MRSRVRLEAADGGYSIRLTVPQTNLLRTCLLELTTLQLSPERMQVQFGFAKPELRALADELTPASTTGAELPVTARELRMAYLALWLVPEMFGTEEDFYIRLGHFKEECRALGKGLLAAVDQVTAEE